MRAPSRPSRVRHTCATTNRSPGGPTSNQNWPTPADPHRTPDNGARSQTAVAAVEDAKGKMMNKFYALPREYQVLSYLGGWAGLILLAKAATGGKKEPKAVEKK